MATLTHRTYILDSQVEEDADPQEDEETEKDDCSAHQTEEYVKSDNTHNPDGSACHQELQYQGKNHQEEDKIARCNKNDNDLAGTPKQQECITAKSKDDIPSIDSIVVEDEELPPYLKAKQYDICILFCESDRHIALPFQELLESDPKFQVKNGPRSTRPLAVCTADDFPWIMSKFKVTETLLQHSTFIFLLVTKASCDDMWSQMQKDETLMETINNPEKRYCLVPVYHTKADRVLDFKVPFGLQSLREIYYKDTPDRYFYSNICKMVESKEYLKRDREREQQFLRDQWIADEKHRRFVVLQKRENEKRLANKRRELELARQHKTLQDNNHDNISKPPFAPPTPMEIMQQQMLLHFMANETLKRQAQCMGPKNKANIHDHLGPSALPNVQQQTRRRPQENNEAAGIVASMLKQGDNKQKKTTGRSKYCEKKHTDEARKLTRHDKSSKIRHDHDKAQPRSKMSDEALAESAYPSPPQVIKEIHHHYYKPENEPEPPKKDAEVKTQVYNIYGAGPIQIGDSNVLNRVETDGENPADDLVYLAAEPRQNGNDIGTVNTATSQSSDKIASTRPSKESGKEPLLIRQESTLGPQQARVEPTGGLELKQNSQQPTQDTIDGSQSSSAFIPRNPLPIQDDTTLLKQPVLKVPVSKSGSSYNLSPGKVESDVWERLNIKNKPPLTRTRVRSASTSSSTGGFSVSFERFTKFFKSLITRPSGLNMLVNED